MALEVFVFGAQKRSLRLDDNGAGYTYIGNADPGALDSAAVWQIMRLDQTATPDLAVLWADGDALYDNIWNDRATLSYS